MSDRNQFATRGLAQVEKILTLADRNRHSPTYGCFDRNFWHYKIIDFPSGMAQELVWPLALAYDLEIPGNPYYHQPAIREWAEAGIRYAARSAHPDGSCDDYFPHEHATGATAFSLLACLESYRLLGIEEPEMREFFERRATWLAGHEESGRLTNHQALVVLCLELAGRLIGTDRWRQAASERLDRILEWQSEEGWFPEYEGFDPGYQTLTISCLARIHELAGRPDRLRQALARAVELTVEFVHPDGSFGGEYTSRNTYNYFPHGFELVGPWMPAALTANDCFLKGLASGRAACYSDDHILGHHAWNYLLAWRDFVTERPEPAPRAEGRQHYPGAGLLIDRRAGQELYLALNKGGVFKLFRDGELVCSDTQVSLQVASGGATRCATAHATGVYETDIKADGITIRGNFSWAKQAQMTTLKLMVLRFVTLTVGRFAPNLIRRILQRLLITGRADAPFRFERTLSWTGESWEVIDVVHATSWKKVRSAAIGSDQTSIYVVMSRTYQPGQLEPWVDLTPELKTLPERTPLTVLRTPARRPA